MTHQTQAASALRIVQYVADTIREVGSAPSGIVYAALMAHGCTLSQFRSIVGILERSGLIVERGNMLRWVGPGTPAGELDTATGIFTAAE